MSISSESSRADYTGNGTQSVFSYAFKIFKEADLLVTVLNTTTKVETTLTLTTDYTVSDVGETAGGNVTLVDAGQDWLDGTGDLDTGYRMTIRRVPDLVQETDIRNQGQYYPEGIENQFDKQVFIDQRQEDEIQRSIRLPETQTDGVDFNTHLPADFAGQADKSLVTNATGDGFDVGPSTDEIANAQSYAIDADEHKQTAERWANFQAGSVVDVDTGVDSGEYSAKAYAIGGTDVTETAARGAAKEWATKTDNPVDTVEYSAKEYAQGVQSGTGGSAKDWATETASDVDGTGEYSSKEHAQGTQTRGLAGGGSAKDWAQYVSGLSTVDDSEFSAKKYAQDAAASAAAAATNAAASLWQDVVFATFGDSPISIVDSDAGKMYSIDTSGGNVVVNLPAISGLTLTGPWSIGFQKSDNSANTVTINANGTDEINGAASLVLATANGTATLIPDTDPTPDQWTSIVVGELPITGDVVGTTDTQTLTNKTIDADNNTITNLEHGAEVDNPTSGVHGVTGSVVGTTDTQDLSGKTFTDAITLEELSATPSTPASGDKKFYAKNDDKLYTLNDAGEEVEVGSGSGGGSGGINYVKNPDADINLDDITGTGNVTVTQATAIRGTFSAQAEFSAAMTTGDYVDYGMENIELADSGKALYVSFDYSTDATTASGDFEVYLYNGVAPLELIVDNGNDGLLDATGGHTTISRFTGKVYLDPSQNGYSLRVRPTAAHGAIRQIRLDRVTVGPDVLVPGAIVTKWIDYTPTGDWTTNTTYNGKYRRVGDTLHGEITIELTGAPNAATSLASVNFLPAGLQVDLNKLSNSSGALQQSIGDVMIYDATGSNYHICNIRLLSATAIRPTESSVSGSNLVNSTISDTNPITFANGDYISMRFSVPIEGWSAGASLSTTEAVFQSAMASANFNSGSHSTSGIVEKVPFDNVVFDTTNSYDSANYQYIAPRSGKCLVSTTVSFNGNTTGQRAIYIFVNGTRVKTLENDISLNTDASYMSGSAILDVTKGDTIDIRAFQNSGGALAYVPDSRDQHFDCKMLEDFSVFSVYGETEYKDILLGSDFTLGNVDTWTLVTGMSLSLSPGKWAVGYHVCPFFNWISGAGAFNTVSNAGIYRSSTSGMIRNSITISSNVIDGTLQELINFQSTQTEIIVTDTETIELRIRSNANVTNRNIQLFATNQPVTLTDPDLSQVLWARRIS